MGVQAQRSRTLAEEIMPATRIWSEHEEALLAEGHARHPNCWKEIAEFMNESLPGVDRFTGRELQAYW